MAFDGYLELGGVEIINVERTQAYVRHMAPNIALPLIEKYEGLHIALGDKPYESPALDGAEWVTTDLHEFGGFVGEYSLHADTATHRFYGMYPLEIQGIGDSTYSAEMTEGVLAGGRAGVGRAASRSIRVHGLLIGADQLAAQLGREWLKGVLDAEDCTMHDSACGTSDLRYFLDFPTVCGVYVKGHAGDGIGFGEITPANSPLTFTTEASPVNPANPYDFSLQWSADWSGTRADGQIIEWGALDPETGRVIESHGPLSLQRSNYAKNPSFALDTGNWTATTSTFSRVATGGVDGGAFGRLTENSPPVVRYNWVPDPAFMASPLGSDITASGWRVQGGTGVSVSGSSRYAAFTKAAGATNLVAEVSLVGPTTPAAAAYSFYLTRPNGSVLIELFDNLGALIYSQTVPQAAGTATINFLAMAGANYVLRLTTAATTGMTLQLPLVELGTTYGSFFSGSTTSTPPTSDYSYVGAPFLSASRARVGAVTAHTLTTLTPDTTYDILTASMYLRSATGASLTLQIVSLDSAAVLGSRVISVPSTWTRFSVGAVLGRNTKLVLSGTGSYDIDQVLVESGTGTVDDYFDGSTPAPAGQKVRWLGPPNGSTSRVRSINPDFWENNTEFDYRNDTVFRAAVDVEGRQITPYLSMVRGRIEDPGLGWGLAPFVPVEDQIAAMERRYHSVKTISSLKVIKEYELDQNAYAIEVEFFLGAEVPWAYGPSYLLTDQWSGLENFLYSDAREVTTNWVPDPSVEGRGALTADLTNRVSNPSAETNTTGYTVIPGTGGTAALTNPVATTPFGTHVLQCTWSVASTTLGGGVYYDVAVVAGAYFSFGMGLVQSSIAQTLQLQIEWRTTSATISTANGIATAFAAGTPGSLKVEALLAPATATIARMRVISVTGGVVWPAGSSLQLDGLMCSQAQFLPTYFDGSVVDPNGEYVYAWGGTAHASGTTRSTYLSTALAAATDAAGGVVDTYVSPVAPWVGTYAVKAEWFIAAANNGGGFIGVGGKPAVVPGNYYGAACWARTSRIQRLVLSVAWYTAANALISRQSSAEVALPATTWTRLTLPQLLAPAGAAYAMLEVTATGATSTKWLPGDWLKVDGAQLTDGLALPAYFDGASALAGYAFAWKGTANASASTKTVVPAVVSGLSDPTLPTIPSPPDAPDVSDIALPDQTDWRRYLVPIPARTVSLWSSTVPTVTLTSKTKEIRQVRIRFMPNPFGRAADKVDPLYYCGEMIVSYIPPATELVVDGITEAGYATIAGQESIPADSVLYGTGGFPVSWPEMTCGTDYVMSVDVLPTLSTTDLNIALSVSLRE